MSVVFAGIRNSLKAGVTSRPRLSVRGSVVHTTESSPLSLWAIVSFFKARGTQADSHYVLGTEANKRGFVDVVRVVPETVKAWTALTANPFFVQYELIGRAAQTREFWLKHRRAQIRTLAVLIADDVLEYGYPVKHGVPGIVGHRDLKRFGFPQTHTDPGVDFPWDVLLADVRYYLALAASARGPAKPIVEQVAVKRSVRKRTGHQSGGGVRARQV